MSNKKIVLLDGRRAGENDLDSIFEALRQVLQASGADVQVWTLRELKLAYCIGCFGCWLETPGLCRYNEIGRTILQQIVQSDTVVLFSPVVFGGYSSPLKQILDRFASLILPYFKSYHGELHHAPRYAHYPRWIGIGVQGRRDPVEANLFRLLVGRNAINYHAPSYAAEVVQQTDDSDKVRSIFQSLLSRKDKFPESETIKALFPAPEAIPNPTERDGARRACLIVGSAKTLSPSTSGVLGNHILGRLKEQGWETTAVTLKPSLKSEQGQNALFEAADRADLLIFAFPLYIDTLPFLMTRALEVLAEHWRTDPASRPWQLFVVMNNGFIESYQNNLALAICGRFAASNSIQWMGALAMGAGEAISGGEPLKPISSQGVPSAHVPPALDAAAAALAQGQPVPAEAVQGIAKNPIPNSPYLFWRWMATYFANQMWIKRAATHGVSKRATFARPYAVDGARLKRMAVTAS